MTSYVDADRDGYAACLEDCDDLHASAHPGGVEVCDDAIDNDCNGTADDVDPDGDGFFCANDCRPNDAGVWATPGETGGLSVSRVGMDAVGSWSEPSPQGGLEAFTYYDAVVSTAPGDFLGSASCVATDTSTRSFTDPIEPPAGSVRFYLLHAENACGGGTFGHASSGMERSVRSCP